MQRTPVNPGTVEWSGENPGIYLKADPQADYSVVALFFSIVLSPHGRGVGGLPVILMEVVKGRLIAPKE